MIWGGVAAIALLALAAPVLGLRLGEPAVDAPKDAAVVQTMDAIQRAFPQAPAPAEVVVTGADVTGPKVLAAVNALRARAAAGGAIHDAGDHHRHRRRPRAAWSTCRWRATEPTPRPTTRC